MNACYGVPGWLPEQQEHVAEGGDERTRIGLDRTGAWHARMSWRRDHLGRWSARFSLSRLSRFQKGSQTVWREALIYEKLSDEEALVIWRELPKLIPSPLLDDQVALLRVRCAVG